MKLTEVIDAKEVNEKKMSTKVMIREELMNMLGYRLYTKH